jgi:hypothetical protein
MKKKNNDQIDLNQTLIAGAAEIAMRVMELSNQGLISYTPNQVLPDDNPDLCILVASAIMRMLACDLLIQDDRYKNRRKQLEAQVRAIMAQGDDGQKTVEQINQAIGTEASNVTDENQELIRKEIEKLLPKALEFIKDKYKIRFEWMISSLVLDSVLSVSPIALSPGLVRNIHALEDWIVQEDLKLPKQESRSTKPDYDLTKLPDYYRDLQKTWQSAKKDAQKAQNDPLLKGNWRKRIKVSYLDDLPDDLIEWLNENEQERQSVFEARTDLIYLSKKLKDGYVISKPSQFALEHSARLCGAPPYYYSITRLFEILREKQALWFKPTL